ncbi:ArsR/SmtB family transcription factor [Streptomyces coffeae]|uniref:Winged helix-turn-helix transcriptional regulator n=1 Tax=Streptomyces coffeae TaxID=621382 RepID=A0ABS1NGG2_9ACTN|nr:ArsR family transcriptional regulator [Streptomyces coffeae]MBL1099197.1 winged helix-turn-helix transcriptional regulator [Streptomyces coffeae]
MLRVRFTADDLLRVTFAREPAPLMELGLALAAMQRIGLPPVFGRWQQSLRRTLPRGARPLLELVPPSGRGPLFMDPLSRGLDDGLDAVLSTPGGYVRSELDRVCSAGRRPVTPWLRALADQDRDAWRLLADSLRTAYDSVLGESWGTIRSAFDAERAWRTRLLAEEGIRATLAGLAPGPGWRGTTLEFDWPEEALLELDGRGLVLLPTTVWSGWPMLALRPGLPSVLVYPALSPLPLLGEVPRAEPLAALLGSTRAAALGLLTRQRTTTDLAAELSIAKSSASEHAKALRAARLITTERDGKAVWHSCTPLGLDLLAGTGGPGPAPRAQAVGGRR